MAIPDGWKPQSEVDSDANPAEYSAVIHNLRVRSGSGDTHLDYTRKAVRVVTDARTGEIQIYQHGGFLAGPDILLGTYSSQEAKWAPNKDQESRWNSYFSPELNPKGSEQLSRITSSTKARTVEIAEAIVKDKELSEKTGLTDATVTALKNTPGYQSQNNTETKDSVSEEDLKKQRLAREKEIAETGVDPLAPPVPEGPPETNPTVDVPEELENVQSRPADTYAKELIYPEALRQQTQDYLKIQMVEYKPRGTASNDTGSLALQSRTNLQRGGELAKDKDNKPFRKLLSTIYLPIPGGISDNNTANWSKGDVGLVEGIFANVASKAMDGDASGLKDATTNTAGAVQNNTSGVKGLVKQNLIKSITGVDLLKRNLGAVVNQNTELLFDGPGLRSFSFTFKFSPRGKEEAIVVKKIIRTLKQGMSPKKANNFLFIKSPHTFFLSYHHGTEIHPFLNKFKECALTALSVNYTPDGNYATYYDGSMISYQVTMSFQELEPVFDSDYGNGYNNIGF